MKPKPPHGGCDEFEAAGLLAVLDRFAPLPGVFGSQLAVPKSSPKLPAKRKTKDGQLPILQMFVTSGEVNRRSGGACRFPATSRCASYTRCCRWRSAGIRRTCTPLTPPTVNTVFPIQNWGCDPTPRSPSNRSPPDPGRNSPTPTTSATTGNTWSPSRAPWRARMPRSTRGVSAGVGKLHEDCGGIKGVFRS